MRDLPRRGAGRVVEWSEENIELLRSMWMAGRSATQIAAAFGNGCTKNAIIGKVNRMQLFRNPTGPRSKGPDPVEAILAAEIALSPSVTALAPSAVTLDEHDAETDNAPSLHEIFGPYGIDIMAVSDATCRYIAGDPVDAVYCGLPTVTGSKYCKDHAALCGGRRYPKHVADGAYKQRVKALSSYS